MLQVNRELDPEKNRAGGLCVFIVKGLVLRRRSKMELMMLFFFFAGRHPKHRYSVTFCARNNTERIGPKHRFGRKSKLGLMIYCTNATLSGQETGKG